MKKICIYLSFLTLLAGPVASSSSIWEQVLNQRSSGADYAADTLQSSLSRPTDGVVNVYLDFQLPVMPFLSTYNDWYLQDIPGYCATYPLLAVKLDAAVVDKLPERLLRQVASLRDQLDLFINIQGYPGVSGETGFQSVLLQPHPWMFSSIPQRGGISADTPSRMYRWRHGLTFREVGIDGKLTAHAHDGTLSADSRHIADLGWKDNNSTGSYLPRQESRFYLSAVKVGRPTKTTAEDISCQAPGKTAVTLHMLLSDAEYQGLQPYFADSGLSSTEGRIETLNGFLSRTFSDFKSPAFQGFIALLRALRDKETVSLEFLPLILQPASIPPTASTPVKKVKIRPGVKKPKAKKPGQKAKQSSGKKKPGQKKPKAKRPVKKSPIKKKGTKNKKLKNKKRALKKCSLAKRHSKTVAKA